MMNKMRGQLVYWKFNSFTVSREQIEKHLASLGELPSVKTSLKKYKGKSSVTFLDLMPRNDFKAALIRALKKILKADDASRFYKRLKDKPAEVTFTVIMPIEILEGAMPHYEFKNEVTLTLDKRTGNIKFADKNPFEKIILQEYKAMQALTDADQISRLFTKIVQEEAHGVSLKLGVYYINEKNIPHIDILKKIVDMIASPNLHLFQIPVYNDESTQKAVETAIYEEMVSELEEFKEEIYTKLRKDDMAPKVLENRQIEVQEIFNKLNIHKDDLRSKVEILESKLKNIEKSLDLVMDIKGDKSKQQDIFDLLLNS